jgi:4-amino-4-deoxy-L-arabinose transferase-like glycosyltransferase
MSPSSLKRLGGLTPSTSLLLLALLVAVQTVFTLDLRQLWFSDEVRHADALVNMLSSQDWKGWVVLELNGQIYPDKPPVYFWFLGLISMALGGVSTSVFFIATALSGLFLLGMVLAASKTMLETRRTGLAAGLVLLSNPFFLALIHYSRMDLAFAGLITASHVLLFKALSQNRSFGAALGAFALAGAACLVKGPLGAGFPLITLLAYTLWTGRFARLFRLDMLAGLLVLAAIPGAWLTAAWFAAGQSFIDNILHTQIYARALDTWHHREPFWYYLAVLPAVFLPWTLVVFALPISRLFKKRFWSDMWQNRKAHSPRTFLWTWLIAGFILISAVSIKIPVYLLPLLPPLALLTGNWLQTTTPRRRTRVWLFMGLAFLGLAVVHPLAGGQIPVEVPYFGFWLAALALALGSTLMLSMWISHAGAIKGLMLMVVAWTLWALVGAWLVAPALDPVMSPAPQARLMSDYIEQGYAPVAYKVYDGIYAYHLGQDYPEVDTPGDMARFLESHDKVVVAARTKYWNRWEDRPQDFEIVDRQMMAGNEFLLAVRPLPAE